MNVSKTDYSSEIKSLIFKLYSPLKELDDSRINCIQKSLTEIYEDVISVLPKKWIDESDIYNALVELDFKAFSNVEKNEKTGAVEKTTPLYFLEIK